MPHKEKSEGVEILHSLFLYIFFERGYMEIWKSVIGYEGLYEVSNTGRVRSLNFKGTGEIRELAQRVGNKGYNLVGITKNKKLRKVTVHRLVAEAHIPNPQKLPVVNHINEIKTDCRVENLEWVTPKENALKFTNNHRGKNRNGKLKNVKINQLTLDGKFVKLWDNANKIKCELGKNEWSIKECCKGKRKTAYGYKWEFAT